MNITNMALGLTLLFLPALFWLCIYYLKDYRDHEPKRVIAQTFFVGMMAAIPFLGIRLLIEHINVSSVLFSGILSVFVFAAMEEVAKLSASIFVVTHHRVDFDQVIDGVVYAATAALGFAFVENIIYLKDFLFTEGDYLDSGIFYIVAIRSFGTMLAHTLFSSIAGLVWAYAYFSKRITPFQKKHLLAFEIKDFINREIITLHIIRQNILKSRPSRRGGHEKKILVLEGFFLATVLHAAFNLITGSELFGQNLTFLLVPGVIGGFMWVSYLFTRRVNNKIFKVV